MKKSISSLLFILIACAVQAQSKSYQDLRNHFAGQPDVKSFGFSGPVCRMIVNIIGWEDEEMADALKGVKQVRLMTIPKEEFDNQGLSVRGFQSRLAKDNFEVMAAFRDGGSDLTLYHRPEKKTDRYFMLIEEDGEVLAIEMKGHIDPAIFREKTSEASL
jgi:hypothetical protein